MRHVATGPDAPQRAAAGPESSEKRCICMYSMVMYVIWYIYIERERERERENLYVYIYICVCV